MMDRVCDGYGLFACYVLLLMLIAEIHITISVLDSLLVFFSSS